MSSIVASGAFLEAMVNELYQDAADEHAAPDGYITPLSASCWRLMAELWRSTGSGKMGVIEKYEMLLAFGDAPPLDRGGQTYEHARLVLRLRNAILHFRPENVPAIDEAHAMERSLRGKFADNALVAGSDNSWWLHERHAFPAVRRRARAGLASRAPPGSHVRRRRPSRHHPTVP